MRVHELVTVLRGLDPEAQVHIYDPDHDGSFEVTQVTVEDPRVDRSVPLPEPTVWLES